MSSHESGSILDNSIPERTHRNELFKSGRRWEGWTVLRERVRAFWERRNGREYFPESQ